MERNTRREDFKNIGKICLKFGLLKGAVLFFKIKFGRVRKLKLPNIKAPVSLRHQTSDIPAFYQVIVDEQYEIGLKNPQVIIDGGANIGLFTLQMKSKFPDTKIICIEPDPENFKMLKENTAAYKDVFCENCGIWNKDTRLKVYDKYDMGKWGMVVEEDLLDGSIPAVSINAILRKYDIAYIDILKLDIETSEKQVFSDNFEDWLPKVKTIIIELHDHIDAGCSKPFFAAINRSFSNYKYSTKGENTIIENQDLL